MKMSSVRLVLILVFLTFLGGCSTIRGDGKLAQPGRSVAISLFKCNCEPLIQEAVQDSIVDVFFTNTNAKPIKGENGDITIVGIITMAEGQSSDSDRTSSSSASGRYVTGITIQAYKKGELIATNSVGQDLGKGPLISPVSLAQDAVWPIAKSLARRNEIGYK